MRENTFSCKFLLKSVFVAVLLSACGDTELAVDSGVSLQLTQHRAAKISNLNYRLRFDIPADPDADISAHIVVTFNLSDNSDPLQLDFREDGEKIKRVLSNGTESEYRFTNEHIVVPASELHIGSNNIEMEFIAGPTSLNRNPDYLYTLFVPDRARTAFPLFDQPDLKATYDLTLEFPADWQAMSNAPIDSINRTAGRAEHRFARSDLISSYLFSFVAGRFESMTQERNGRSMTMLHRETDGEKVARNIDVIFDLHAASIEWLEEYTGIAYPYQKFDFALIPTFQYFGMEHVGAFQYQASKLLLDESPSDTELLFRAGVIAHETAHMWFGNLVTMKWFNDVWMKEVFASFMAAKIVNPSFPNINHSLNFLVRHYPAAYAVDRSEGANPIRQELLNLNEAGQMYGEIIYHKAPIMMRQLELLVGDDRFRESLQEYLRLFSFGNATWPDLIQILDAKSDSDLAAWSEVWVNTAGRPEMIDHWETHSIGDSGTGAHVLLQHDAAGLDRVWPQQFEILTTTSAGTSTATLLSTSAATTMPDVGGDTPERVLFNSDGYGYGLFPADMRNLDSWESLDEVEKGSELINIYENLLAGSITALDEYFLALLDIVKVEQNQLILNLALNQIARMYQSLLTDGQRNSYSGELENVLWQTMLVQPDSSKTKIFFDAFADLASSPQQVQKIYEVWSEDLSIDKLVLSENDYIGLAEILAIRLLDQADEIIEQQLQRIQNPDSRRRLEFVMPSLSTSQEVRDAFFSSLADEQNRQTESWVLDALQNLHHPSRTMESEKYILPSLELLQEIQITGDVFFPTGWLVATLQNYRSPSAVATVRSFLEQRPGYNKQLRMKILQSADMLFRANAIAAAEAADIFRYPHSEQKRDILYNNGARFLRLSDEQIAAHHQH